MNPIRYRAYYYDKETGLYFLNSRYYDPEIGRFITPDSYDYLDSMTIGGIDLYAYCNNDPVNCCAILLDICRNGHGGFLDDWWLRHVLLRQ